MFGAIAAHINSISGHLKIVIDQIHSEDLWKTDFCTCTFTPTCAVHVTVSEIILTIITIIIIIKEHEVEQEIIKYNRIFGSFLEHSF